MNNDQITLDNLLESIQLDEEKHKIDIDVSDIVNKSDKKKDLDSKSTGILKSLATQIGKILSNYAIDKSGDLIDELLLGQFKDSVLDIYKKEKLDFMKDDEAQEIYQKMKKDTKFTQGEDKSNLSSRKDDNQSTDIAKDSRRYFALWRSGKKEEDVKKLINNLVVEIQKAAQESETEQKKLVADLKKMKVDATDDDIKNYGPMLVKAVADGTPGKEISKLLKKLRKEVKESYDLKIITSNISNLIIENKLLLTEGMKKQFLVESIVETDEFRNLIAEQMMINEGFFGNILKTAAGVSAGAVIYKVLPEKWKDKVKDFGSKVVKTLTNKTLQGIVSLGGLAVSVCTGGWGATLALKAIYAVEKHGKQLSNAFERQFTRFANSKGIITKMDFAIEGKKDLKYSMRFYSKDMVWRVVNVSDQLKQPGKEYVKSIVNGEEGKAYREQLAKIWDPLFDSAKGGKIDFIELFKQAKNVSIPEKSLKAYQDFAEQYETIKANCIDSPKIDVRAQSLKS